jgi:hypothetical protein
MLAGIVDDGPMDSWTTLLKVPLAVKVMVAVPVAEGSISIGLGLMLME